MGGVVAGQCMEGSTKVSRLDVLKQGQEGLFILPRQDEIVAFFEQWDKIEVVLVSRGLQTERHICLARYDQEGGFGVGMYLRIVAIDHPGWDSESAQLGIEPKTRPRSGVPIHKAKSSFDDVRKHPHPPGIPPGKHETLCAIGQRDNFHIPVREQVPDKRRVVFAGFVQQMRAADLAQPLTKIHKSIQRADGQIQESNVSFKMPGYPFERKVMTARKNQRGFLRLRENNFLQDQRVRFGAVELLDHLARLADFACFDEIRRLEREDVVADPGGRLLHRPRQMRERGGGSHEQTQDVQAAGISEQLDLIE